MMINNILDKLDLVVPNPKCELEYNKDYELLIATVLSAQSTDKRVNIVTKELFNNYSLYDLANIDIKKLEDIIKPVGTYNRKSIYIKDIANRLIKDYDGIVPNDRSYLESLPGVGRKTTNVVLYELYNVPTIAVDTHVMRVSKRLGLSKKNDNVLTIEKKLMKKFPKDKWGKIHQQLVLFGRYTCKSIKPNCAICPFNDECRYKQL